MCGKIVLSNSEKWWNMKNLLVVSFEKTLEEHMELARDYGVALEINDFYEPDVLDNPERIKEICARYRQVGIPEGSTMHGAFLDVILHSRDEAVSSNARRRMKQSMEIALDLGLRAVIFHTNYQQGIAGEEYVQSVIDKNAAYLEELLKAYPTVNIYLENMFEESPYVIAEISKRLAGYDNYGVCLDYGHMQVYGSDIMEWVEELAPYVKHLHINDNDLKQDLHLAIGAGLIDWNEFALLYNKYFTHCTTLVEIYDVKQQKVSLDYVEKLQYTEETGGVVMDYNAEEMLQQIFYYMNLLVGEKNFDKTISILTQLGRVLVNADRTSFWYWDKEKKQYWTLASLGTDRIVVPEGSGIIGASIMNKETIIIDAPYEDARFNTEVDKATGYVTKSILCMPVTDEQGEVIGGYQAINKLGEDGNAVFNSVDVDRLALAAVYCGKLLENHLLQSVSRMDKLTRLKNRHSFEQIYQACVAKDTNCGVIMCDIDFFKKVNDTYGHNGGDAVLISIANILKECIAERGEVIRWGGEEFLILLPDTHQAELAQTAEFIRACVEQSVCVYEQQMIHVTMSFGVAMIDRSKVADDNIKTADEKLYLAKANGRNRVVE